jgi:hypothetical protein
LTSTQIAYLTFNNFLKIPMKHYCEEWLNEWCAENGWTDLYVERSHYWAFPPGGVMPEPLPREALKLIKAEKGLSGEERFWSITSVIVTLIAAVLSYFLKCPMPMVLAFAFGAITVALLEVEDN